MLLKSAHVTNFRSIEDSTIVSIDPSITVLVGQNESGKTAFLQALNKARPATEGDHYDLTEDFPRRKLNEYERQHQSNPATAAVLTYEAQQGIIEWIRSDLKYDGIESLTFSVTHKYDNKSSISLNISEQAFIKATVEASGLPLDLKNQISTLETLRELIDRLNSCDLNSEETEFLTALKEKFDRFPQWGNLLSAYIWTTHIKDQLPMFLYFDDYYLLPGKINLQLLQQRVQQPQTLTSEDRTVLGLLRMANVDLRTLTNTSGYENIKAKLEGISNSITDKVFEYWTQNKELDVEFDIREDPHDQPPFNSGSNLYIRIKNRRHRVTVPFSQRSKGFIWFFSFIVWFDSIKKQLGTTKDLILLLDEPGLSLHALAQNDFLNYIDDLAKDHQILYTTHSPFMVRSERLHQVRTVEDQSTKGTVISDNISMSDSKTLFPLQAALGYTIAQNLFISKNNLLVEGSADLVYLEYFSALLEQQNRTSLRHDVTIVPVGGLDKIATFIALLGANDLNIVVLHDYENGPDQRLETLIQEKLIREKQILTYAEFRGSSDDRPQNSDVEDLISPNLYLKIFNAAFKNELGGAEIIFLDLPPHDRIIKGIEQYLKTSSIKLRPSSGFNHYRVANYLAAHPLDLKDIDEETLDRFKSIFSAVNPLFE